MPITIARNDITKIEYGISYNKLDDSISVHNKKIEETIARLDDIETQLFCLYNEFMQFANTDELLEEYMRECINILNKSKDRMNVHYMYG